MKNFYTYGYKVYVNGSLKFCKLSSSILDILSSWKIAHKKTKKGKKKVTGMFKMAWKNISIVNSDQPIQIIRISIFIYFLLQPKPTTN